MDFRRGGNFNSSFLHISFLNLTVKKYKHWTTFAEVIVKTELLYFLRHGVEGQVVEERTSPSTIDNAT